MKNATRVAYCGTEDSFFKKLSKYAKDFQWEAKETSFSGSPQQFARNKHVGALLIKIKKEFDLKHQEWLSRNDASVPVIVVCQDGTMETAIHALQYGVFDYFCLSQGVENITQRIQTALGWRNSKLAATGSTAAETFCQGKDPEILRLNEQVRELARESNSFLIRGEVGSGKEHLAQAVYRNGASEAALLKQDCRFLQQIAKYDNYKVSDLIQTYLQPFLTKHGSPVFYLSHMEQLAPAEQQEIAKRCDAVGVRLLGSYQERDASSFQNEVTAEVPSLQIPPLRYRKEDIPILVDYFIKESAEKHHVPAKAITEETLMLMKDYSWPGNVQELKNTVEKMLLVEPSRVICVATWEVCNLRALQLNPGGIDTLSSLLQSVLESNQNSWRDGHLYEGFIQQMQKILIDLVMPTVDHNQALAARILGISRNTLRQRLRASKLN